VEHWCFECRGCGGEAELLRGRHREIIQQHLGLDILDDELRWWLLPLAAGHVHPQCWKHCSYLAHGALQWAGPRAKVLYLMVRLMKMGCDMWNLRCTDVYSRLSGWDAERRDSILRGSWMRGSAGAKSAQVAEGAEGAQDAKRKGLEVELEASAQDAKAPIEQWRAGDTPEHAEGCGVCHRELKTAKHCRVCELRHCCGTEELCPRCVVQEEEEQEHVRGAEPLLDPDLDVEEAADLVG
jgi:hypothetical protein